MDTLSWLQILQLSRRNPEMFGVVKGKSLVANAVKAPVNVVYDSTHIGILGSKQTRFQYAEEICSVRPYKRYFDRIQYGSLHLSQTQYLWIFECGSLREEVDYLLDWTSDVILAALIKVYRQILELNAGWAFPFQTNMNPLSDFVCNLVFAKTGFVAIRSQQGLCYQCYQDGWTVTPPTMVQDVLPEIGCAVGASLTTEWFPELPFTLEMATAAIPEELSSLIRVIWHDTDDILPTRFVTANPLELIQSLSA